MTKYREIIRLAGLGLSQTNIVLKKYVGTYDLPCTDESTAELVELAEEKKKAVSILAQKKFVRIKDFLRQRFIITK